jgi:hypothetical protein
MGGRRILSDDQLDQMADMREAGATLVAIADHFISAGTAITPSTIAWQCLRLGILSPRYTQASVGHAGTIGRAFTPDEDRRLLELEAQGLTRSAIARALGRSPNSIAGRLYTLARHDAVAEECPPLATVWRQRQTAAKTKHRRKRQLERARAKVERLERECQHVR